MTVIMCSNSRTVIYKKNTNLGNIHHSLHIDIAYRQNCFLQIIHLDLGICSKQELVNCGTLPNYTLQSRVHMYTATVYVHGCTHMFALSRYDSRYDTRKRVGL